jgi:glycosyltransferase involved in cell wall biosynthesis
VLVTEDCSTDGTRAIAHEYAARHPDRVRLFLSERNLCTNEVTARAIRAARGEYLAPLDGDDCWTSTGKLQRQSDHLDAHPSAALCFHNVTCAVEGADEAPWLNNQPDQRPVTTVHDLLAFCYIAGCSAMVRRSALGPLPAWYSAAEYGDWPLYILAARHGAVHYLPDVMGHYRVHAQGYWTGLSELERHRMTLSFLRRLHRHLEPELRADVRVSIAAVHYLLADELERRDEHLAALRAVGRSLAVARTSPRIPPRGRVELVTRAARGLGARTVPAAVRGAGRRARDLARREP